MFECGERDLNSEEEKLGNSRERPEAGTVLQLNISLVFQYKWAVLEARQVWSSCSGEPCHQRGEKRFTVIFFMPRVCWYEAVFP